MEMATAVVGLVGVGTQISLLLGQFISGCVNAPALVQTVHHEVNHFNSILSLLQPLLLGSSPLNKSRASMVCVDQLALTITGCVCILSELEKEVEGVNRLKSGWKMGVWDRLKWSRMEPTISQHFQHLISYKSSLMLILTILTSPSLAEATNCSVTLHEQLVEGIPHMLSPSRLGVLGSPLEISGGLTANTDSISAAAGPESAVGHFDSTMADPGSTVDNSDSDVDGSESIMTRTDSRVVNLYRLTCESILFTTRPYRGRSNGSVISLASSQRPKPSWSLIPGGSNRSVLSLPVSDYEFSGLSLAEASDMSTLPLPITVDKLRNSRWYGSNPTDTPPPSLISTRSRDGSLELFESRNKILSPLHRAAELGQIIQIGILLEQGADIEAKDEGGKTALYVAARNNRAPAVELLLDRGADMEAKDQGGFTPLHSASWNGHNSIVGLLLDRGADVEAKGQDKFTPLHRAAFHGHDSTVGLLLDRGADMEAETQGGGTPLHYAALNGHDSAVGLLLNRGADIEVIGQRQGTPLHYAASHGHGSTVGLLLDRGADMEVKTQSGATPLHYAARGGYDSTVGLLLDRGADMEAKTQYGNTPLDRAVWGSHDSTVGLLLDRGADMEAKSQEGKTSLHYAARDGHDSTAGLLLDRGADIEAKTQRGETPLHHAVLNGHVSTVGLLLNKGADKQVKTQSGETLLDLARRRKYSALYQLLQEDIL